LRRDRKAFTAVELLIVMLILALLLGLIVMGLNHYSRRSKERDTRATLQNLMAMLRENEGTLPVTLNPLPAPGSVVGSSPDRTGPAVRQTRDVLARLQAMPVNRKAFESFPSDKRMQGMDPVVLDGWGNPILFVPSGGLAGVTASGSPDWNPNIAYSAGDIVKDYSDSQRVTKKYYTAIANHKSNIQPYLSPQNWFEGIRSRNGRPFFVSAGPDGVFSLGDDNVNSIEN